MTALKLIPHWRRVLFHAWSLWPVYAATVLDLAIELLPYVADWLPWWAPVAMLVLTPLFRIIKQEKLDAREPHRQD